MVPECHGIRPGSHLLWAVTPSWQLITRGTLDSRAYSRDGDRNGAYWTLGQYVRRFFGESNHEIMVGLSYVGGNTPEKAEVTRVLAANQGLYNGFLAAGLAYGVATGSREFCLFFLACVVVAGLYGAYSVSRRIFLVQAVPALLAIAAVLLLR